MPLTPVSVISVLGGLQREPFNRSLYQPENRVYMGLGGRWAFRSW